MFLYGDSGDGKSSLVNAGLLPQAQQLGFEPVRVRVQPRKGEELVIEQIARCDDGSELLPSVLAAESEGSARVVLSIAEFEQRVGTASHEHQPLIVFDQFEEIVTLFEDPDAVASRHALADMIVGLLGESLPVKLLFAFREDYLGRVKQLLAARPELVDQALRLGPPSADELETIIRGPFERFPGRFAREFDPALAQRLRAALAERFGTGEVSLSEVQTVCLRLWQSSDPSALLAEKGVQGLLEDELGEALDAFPPALRAVAVALLSEMVTSAGTRNVISAEDLRQRVLEKEEDIDPRLLDDALDRLERESKLIRRERRRDLYLYEITSEFIVPWISRRREELRLAQERRRERRRMRIFGSIAGALLVLAAIVAAIAVWALAQRADAQRKASEATSLALTTSSAQPLATRPDVSLALAFEAYREHPRAETSSAVVGALLAARRSGLHGVLHDTGPVQAVAFSPDGRTLASGAGDGKVGLWNLQTRRRLGDLAGHAGRVAAVTFSPDGRILASGGENGTVRLWRTATRKPLAHPTSAGGGRALAFSPDGTTFAYAAERDTIGLWDVAASRRLGRLTGHRGVVNALAFSPDGKAIASASNDATVRIWNIATRTVIKRLRHTEPIRALSFSSDDRTLAYAGDDTKVRLWDIATRRHVDEFDGKIGRILTVAFNRDGKTLAYAGDAHTVHFWDTASRTQVDRLTGHTGVVNTVAFSRDGRTGASAGEDGAVRLWDARRRQLGRLTGHDGGVYGLAFSPAGGTLASGGYDGTTRLWDPSSGAQLTSLGGGFDTVDAVAFNPDGTILAAAGSDGSVDLWDVAARRRLRTLGGPGSAVNAVAFSPDGRTVASAGDGGRVRLWNAASGSELGSLGGGDEPLHAVAFNRAGTMLASGGDETDVRLWNVATRRQVVRLAGHDGVVTAVAFRPDGTTLASGSNDGTVRLWNIAARRALDVLPTAAAVRAVAFSPDGRSLAYGGDDGAIRLWQAADRTQLGAFKVGQVNALAFSRDGKTLATAGNGGTIRLWTGLFWRSLTELRTTVCEVIVTGLSRSEWSQYANGISYRRSCP